MSRITKSKGRGKRETVKRKRTPRPKKKPKSARRRAARRSPTLPQPEVILPVALSEFSRRGYQRTSLRVIAKHAGVGLRAIVRRYPTKEALGLALLEWRARQMLSVFSPNGPLEPIRERLDRAFDALIHFYFDHNGVVAKLNVDLWKALSKEREARLRLSWTHAQWQELIQEILDAGIRRGEIRPIEPAAAAAALTAACEGMALREILLGGATTPEAFRASLVALITST